MYTSIDPDSSPPLHSTGAPPPPHHLLRDQTPPKRRSTPPNFLSSWSNTAPDQLEVIHEQRFRHQPGAARASGSPGPPSRQEVPRQRPARRRIHGHNAGDTIQHRQLKARRRRQTGVVAPSAKTRSCDVRSARSVTLRGPRTCHRTARRAAPLLWMTDDHATRKRRALDLRLHDD